MRYTTLLLSLFLLASPAQAAEITVTPNGTGGGVVFVVGDLDGKDYDKFVQATTGLYDYEHTVVSLKSLGGAGGALDLGDHIRRTGMNTWVSGDNQCLSICAFIWLSGARRFASKELTYRLPRRL